MEAMSIQKRLKLSGTGSPAQRAAWFLAAAASHLNQRWAELCARHGITVEQYNALRVLRGAHPGGHPRYEVAARLISQPTSVTRLLDRLERQGLAERVRSGEDRRLSLTYITDEGLRLLERMDPEMNALEESMMAPLTAAQQGALAALCDPLVP